MRYTFLYSDPFKSRKNENQFVSTFKTFHFNAGSHEKWSQAQMKMEAFYFERSEFDFAKLGPRWDITKVSKSNQQEFLYL